MLPAKRLPVRAAPMEGCQPPRRLRENVAKALHVPARAARQDRFHEIAEPRLPGNGSLDQHPQLWEERQRLGDGDGGAPAKLGLPERTHTQVGDPTLVAPMGFCDDHLGPVLALGLGAVRSEERRVGKEGRSRWSRCKIIKMRSEV